MVTTDPTIVQEASLPFRRHPSPLVLPEDPSEEELAHHWTLSTRDKAEVFQCRGDAQRRRFAVQLCTLRAYGRFLPKAVSAPVAITNHLARQLDLPPVLFGEIPERLATETDHLQRIRTYLGWRPFDDEARERLTRWLTQRTTDDVLPYDLMARAEDILRTWQVILPDSSTLEELIASVTVRVQDEVYTRILTGLTPELLHAMDDLLQVPAGERHSLLFQLKEYPPEASPAVILRYMARYHFLGDLGVGTMELRRVSLPMIRHFAEVTKRYDVRALRRFPPAKRYALTACFLVEVHKAILDHIVALHDQLLTQKMREAKHAFEEHYQQVRRQYRRGLATLIHTGETFLDPERPPETTLAALRRASARPRSRRPSPRASHGSAWRTAARSMPCGRAIPVSGAISQRSLRCPPRANPAVNRC